MDRLVHLIYASTATSDMSTEDIYEIFSIARLNNKELGVSGLLLFVEGHFLQILEGPETKVLTLYEKISKDPRHAQCKKILLEEIEEPNFAEWSMGYAGVSREELNLIDGLNNFFKVGVSLADVNAEKVERVLLAFKEGRWRNKIQ